jgi:hypothetical protein
LLTIAEDQKMALYGEPKQTRILGGNAKKLGQWQVSLKASAHSEKFVGKEVKSNPHMALYSRARSTPDSIEAR